MTLQWGVKRGVRMVGGRGGARAGLHHVWRKCAGLRDEGDAGEEWQLHYYELLSMKRCYSRPVQARRYSKLCRKTLVAKRHY